MFTTRPELRGTLGMVASTHWLASAAGMSVLETDGNAFDAAVTAGFVLQVVEPNLNGPGGEVPIVLYSAREDEVSVVCGQGPVPEAASIEIFRSLELDAIPGTGLLPACVPGAFDAWMLTLKEFGTKSVREVMTPAIEYALRGYPLLPRIANTIDAARELFAEWPTSAEIYLPHGRTPEPGRLFSNPVLGETFARIVEEAERASADRDAQIDAARDGFYRGFVAEAVGDFINSAEVMDSSGRRHRGLLSADDLSSYDTPIESPVTFDYHNYTVCKTGPWGQGPVFLQQLSLLEGFDIDSMEPGGALFVHTVIECAKLAFADREAYYGDPRFVDVPLDVLLDKSYAQERRSLVSDDASHELRPGRVDGPDPRLPPGVRLAVEAGAGTGEPTIERDTCHIDVVDRDGNIVSATPSGGWLQSSPCVPGLGFSLGTRGQMFWLTEGLPNSLEGSKRPRTTLTPSLAMRDGCPYMAFGTPGGDQQDQWALIFFLNHVHFGMDLQAAIDEPTFHTEHFPSSFYPRGSRPGSLAIEGRFDKRVVEKLTARGHDVTVEDDWSLGRVSAAAMEADGVLKAAANARGMQGYAVGR
jgi:gamma-glutamyltranspeptidase / glutathione hydrolase